MAQVKCSGCGWMFETQTPPIPKTEKEWEEFDEWLNDFMCDICQRREERISAGQAEEVAPGVWE